MTRNLTHTDKCSDLDFEKIPWTCRGGGGQRGQEPGCNVELKLGIFNVKNGCQLAIGSL